MLKVNFNGKLLPKDSPILNANNRGFKYGDGLFETMRCIDGHIPFVRYHYQRLTLGMKILSINVPRAFSLSYFKKEILKLTKNKQSRVRFSIYRNGEGLYLPKQNDFNFIIEANPLTKAAYQLNEKGLHLGVSKKVTLTFDQLAPLKTLNALPYVLAANERHNQKVDDIILLNSNEQIAEANSSNLFVWTGRSLKTPPLTAACIIGVIRTLLLEKANTLGINATERNLTLDDLRKAKSIFLTNSINGIRWVNRFENSIFEPTIGGALINLLNDLSKR